jgi:hypothetical protein
VPEVHATTYYSTLKNKNTNSTLYIKRNRFPFLEKETFYHILKTSRLFSVVFKTIKIRRNISSGEFNHVKSTSLKEN